MRATKLLLLLPMRPYENVAQWLFTTNCAVAVAVAFAVAASARVRDQGAYVTGKRLDVRPRIGSLHDADLFARQVRTLLKATSNSYGFSHRDGLSIGEVLDDILARLDAL